MAELIENYLPQETLAAQKSLSLWVWLIGLAVAVTWVSVIISAPVFEDIGLKSISQPIYSFFSFMCHQMSSRSFHYHDHQFAVCARCFGFYGGFLWGFVVYPLIRQLNTTDSFPRFWLFAAMIPMGIDFSLTFFDIWENTHLSRLITGGILGFACAFFIIPALVEISFFKYRPEKYNDKA